MSKTVNDLNKSLEDALELSSKYSKAGHTHSYLPLSGGTMTGNITFTGVTSTTYPAKSNTLTWSGSTDGADIYYQVDASDKGRLVLNTRDDADCVIAFANNGTIKTTIDNSGNFSGKAAKADTLNTARTLTIGNTGKTFNGSANVSWTLSEIGAAAASHGTHLTIGTGASNAAAGNHTHSYLPLSGGTMTGKISGGAMTGTWVAAAGGSSFINSTASAGTFHPMLSAKTTNGGMTLAFYQNGLQVGYLTKANIDAGTNTLAKNAMLMDESGNGTWPGTVSAGTFKENGTALSSKYASSSSVGTLSSLKTSAKGNLVAAINELFQNANDGKQLIASAIGSPLSSSDTFSAMSTKINTMNTNLKNFLVQSGAKIESGKESLNDLISLLISDSIMLKFPIEFDLNSLPVSCGQYHAAILKNTGTIATVGYNYSGQLGIGNTTNKTVFTTPSTAVIGVVQVECGGSHTVVLKRDGSVMVTGENSSGQLGLNTQDDALSFTGMLNVNNDVIKVACGTNHTLVLKSDGVVWGTGSNSSGQLGIGTNTNAKTLTKSPLTNVIDIIAGGSHSFAIDRNGDVWCTGLNGNGQLGMGNYTNYSSFVKVTSLSNVKQIACGTNHTLVLKNDGTVWATGYNYYGQLGLGTSGSTANRNEFVKVSINSVSHIACGAYHSVLVKTDGTIWAAGNNDDGQLGLGNTTGKTTFTQVTTNVSNAAYVFCGANFTYYMRKDGTVWTCGGNDKGQIAIGTTTKNLTFVGLSSSLLG